MNKTTSASAAIGWHRPLTSELVKTSAKGQTLRDFESCDCGLSLCLYVDRSCPTTVMKTGL